MDEPPKLEWFYVDQTNESKGPFAERDIDALFRANDINTSTPVWKEGMQDWEPLGKQQQFIDNLAEDEIQMVLQSQPVQKLHEDIEPVKQEDQVIFILEKDSS